MKLTKENFQEKMYETDLLFDDLELSEFVEEHFQNLLTFEENKNNFLKFIEVE